MHITYHAAERFLQRVFQFKTYTKEEVKNATYLLKCDLNDLQIRNSRISLPSFPKYYGVFRDNTLVTVIPKR